MSRGFTVLLLASLYLAQGLPFGFFTQALPVLLRERGLSLTAISLTSVLFLPWAMKFLWAPLVDRTGTRKIWIVATQLLTLAGALALGFMDLSQGFGVILGALVVFNLLAATQDIATDGLTVRVLSTAERGLGNGIQVGAYRLGMILGGGALLWIFARSGWTVMFWSMAAILALTCVPAFFLRDTLAGTHAAQGAGSARREDPVPRGPVLAAGWVVRARRPGIPSFIAVICAYKFGEAAASSLVSPFLHDAGLSTETIALVKGTLGSGMAVFGSALGGWLAGRAGRRRSLIVCGITQALGMLAYVACTLHPGERMLIYGACCLEHLLASMATVSLFALMMDASDPAFAGTDYTLFACAIILASGAASVVAGMVGDHFGYGAAFLGAAAVSAAGCLFLVSTLDRGGGPPRLSRVWARADSR